MLDTELHFTCFVEAPEAVFRQIARERDGGAEGEEKIEKERAEVARGTGTGMRLIELDGRREGPIDRGECKDLLKVSCTFFFLVPFSVFPLPLSPPRASHFHTKFILL